MKFAFSLLLALATALFAFGAGAQSNAPAKPAPAAAPAAAAASAAAAEPAKTKEVLEKEAAGQLAANGWLVLLDRRDWGRAWEASSSLFRSTVPLPTWMDAIPKVREQLGPLVERSPAVSVYKTKLEGRPDGEYVTVIFESKFEKKEVQEALTTVRDSDGRWRVTGYSTR
jgi:hypothetical protein